ncbi:MAG TPA: 6-phosphogluconolactonase, partial [Elusimicrobiota bacterium]|nr:6-phosphogluconolactonase [Elusimicrobiota bacterium]
MSASRAPVVFRDGEELADALARELLFIARRAVSARGRFVLALAGGTTPAVLYRRLARPPYKKSFPWRFTHFFWGDERFVPPTHPESNYRRVREALLDRVRVPPENRHPVPTGLGTPAAAAKAYERELRRFFSSRPFPRFDVVLLGVGEDGHVASLFPRSAALNERKRW